jgi:DUF2971 family protein
MSKRVYKFISAGFGIADLKDRRLKLSTIDDLNDPFDLYAIDTTAPQIAYAVTMLVAQIKEDTGLLCFSRNWDNLLLWSHYAASHTGLCLGFDILDHPPEARMYVQYQPRLLKISDVKNVPLDLAKRLLSTKRESWSYEQEVRMFVGITDRPDEMGLFWFQFGPDLQLREVIIGAQCRAEHAAEVCEVLKGYPDQIDCTWAYMRSDAFLLVRDKTAHADVFRPSERTFALRGNTSS